MRRLLSNFRAAVLSLSLSALVIRRWNGSNRSSGTRGDPASANLAQTNPDEYAWRLFDSINLQAARRPRELPASGKTITQYDDDTATVWETWRCVGRRCGQEGSEVFKPDGSDRAPGTNLPRAIRPLQGLQRQSSRFASALNESLGFGTRHFNRWPANKGPLRGAGQNSVRPQIPLLRAGGDFAGGPGPGTFRKFAV